jgi:hypothetical protein
LDGLWGGVGFDERELIYIMMGGKRLRPDLQLWCCVFLFGIVIEDNQ